MKLINILKEMSLDTSNLPDGGDCFDSAFDYMVEHGTTNKTLKLVHSIVSGQGKLSGKRYTHAWCEDGDNVIDTSNGNNFQVLGCKEHRAQQFSVGECTPNALESMGSSLAEGATTVATVAGDAVVDAATSACNIM